MGWSGGVFSRIHNWVSDANASIGIEPDRHDEEDDNLAAGITAALHRGGQNSPTADIDWGDRKITNLKDATDDKDALNRRSADARYLLGMNCRITLSSGVPVMTSDVTGATTIYVTPFGGKNLLIWNGTAFQNHTFEELSQATTDGTKSPSAVAADKNYDIFVWDDDGTLRATRGPAWSSDTSRGTGAGTSELEVVDGIIVNKVSIANGPGARFGTYAGTVRSNSSSQIDWKFGGTADGGTAAVLGVWNMFNRVDVWTQVRDSTNTWTGGSGIGAANGSSTNRVSFISGIALDAVISHYHVSAYNTTDYSACGIGYDSTSSFSGLAGIAKPSDSGEYVQIAAAYGAADIGFHYMQALDYQIGGGTVNYAGDLGTGGRFMALTVTGRF